MTLNLVLLEAILNNIINEIAYRLQVCRMLFNPPLPRSLLFIRRMDQLVCQDDLIFLPNVFTIHGIGGGGG